jgi:hypothetical protein
VLCCFSRCFCCKGSPHFFLPAIGEVEESSCVVVDPDTRGYLCYRSDFEVNIYVVVVVVVENHCFNLIIFKKVLNFHNQKLQCSWYDREDLRTQPHACVLYLHANSGSRVNAKQAVKVLLPMGISVVTFDFAVSIVGLICLLFVWFGWVVCLFVVCLFV